jgi:DNA-binding LytR/AlgR family response regulator
MKIRIETDETLSEPEVVIRCRKTDDDSGLQEAITTALLRQQKLPLKKDEKEYYVSPQNILFFEVTNDRTYAHARDDIFQTKLRLYELENLLSSDFVRASKSVIINARHVLSITRNLAGPSLVEFRGSHKRINVSRSYFKQLRDKLNERS